MACQKSKTLANAIRDGWIYRHGPPNSMLSDYGPKVDGYEVRNYLVKCGIHKMRSSTCHQKEMDRVNGDISPLSRS